MSFPRHLHKWESKYYISYLIIYLICNLNHILNLSSSPVAKIHFYLHLALNEELMLLLICIKGRSSSRQCSLISLSLTLTFVWVRSGVWREETVSRWIPLPTVSSLGETVTWSSTVTNREAGSSISSTPGKSITCLQCFMAYYLFCLWQINRVSSYYMCDVVLQAGPEVHSGRAGSFCLPYCPAGRFHGRSSSSGGNNQFVEENSILKSSNTLSTNNSYYNWYCSVFG